MLHAHLRLLAALVVALTAGSSPGCTPRQPPALSGITIAALDEQNGALGTYAARTALNPPLPVIGVRPGRPPKVGTLLWNEPSSGMIHITLARGTQSFTFHTTDWTRSSRFVLALFFDGSELPTLVMEAGRPIATSSRLLTPIGLNGDPLPVQPEQRQAYYKGFEIRVEELLLPYDSLQLDLVGPWRLQPDHVADLVGCVVLTAREIASR